VTHRGHSLGIWRSPFPLFFWFFQSPLPLTFVQGWCSGEQVLTNADPHFVCPPIHNMCIAFCFPPAGVFSSFPFFSLQFWPLKHPPLTLPLVSSATPSPWPNTFFEDKNIDSCPFSDNVRFKHISHTQPLPPLAGSYLQSWWGFKFFSFPTWLWGSSMRVGGPFWTEFC